MKSSTLFRLLIIILLALVVLAILFPSKEENPKVTTRATHTIGEVLPTPTPLPTPSARTTATLTVNGTQWGQSTCYIGAVEGSSRFNISDLLDLGINTYRIFGGMPRWEAQDDSGIYGYPSISQIKANPNIINWTWWDNIMTNPPKGSDYWWVPNPRWQGNARMLFNALQVAHIRTIISLRNQDDQHNPKWAPNPPTTTLDWNEWWEHVFALVYWLNVRNNYDINDFEVQNEPNIPDQGWRGTEEQYFTFVKYTHDAIDYVYRTYLPGRTYHMYAPNISATVSLNTWPKDVLQKIPNTFDSVDVHIYGDIRSYVEQVHNWMKETGHSNYPLWLTEWGTYTNRYDSTLFGINLIKNLIHGSYPGNDYVYGSDIFSLYDFGTMSDGLISYNGLRRSDYYAMRMGIRALQGCRPTYRSTTSNRALLAITTKDIDGNIYLLVTNQDNTTWYDVNANIFPLMSKGNGTIWQFDAGHMDTIVGNEMLRNGHVTFTIPANGAVLIEFSTPPPPIRIG